MVCFPEEEEAFWRGIIWPNAVGERIVGQMVKGSLVADGRGGRGRRKALDVAHILQHGVKA